jgi:hypothetical protein
MTGLVVTSLSSDRRTAVPADAAQSTELYFPGVQDLLQRLARTRKEERRYGHSLLFGSRAIMTTAVIAFICAPGCATAAMLLMQAGHFDLPSVPTPQRQIFTKACPQPLISSKAGNGRAGDEIPLPPTEAVEEAVLPDSVGLRGTLQSVLFTASIPASPARTGQQKPARRSANRPIPIKPAAERQDAAPPSPSLFEKLFSVIVSVTQWSQQPGQRQT